MRDILFATHNPGKLARYTQYFEGLNLHTLTDLGIKFKAKEYFDGVKINAILKALHYRHLSSMLTIAEDSGLFIYELKGLPGVAVRQWGGELKEELSDTEFLNYFLSKVIRLRSTRCYLQTFIAIASSYEVRLLSRRTEGYIDVKRFSQELDPGYPLSAVFVRDENGKTWNEMNEGERVASQEVFMKQTHAAVLEMYEEEVE